MNGPERMEDLEEQLDNTSNYQRRDRINQVFQVVFGISGAVGATGLIHELSSKSLEESIVPMTIGAFGGFLLGRVVAELGCNTYYRIRDYFTYR